MPDQPDRAPVRLLIVHPRDPAAPTLGGIQTFLHDLIKYAPDDFEISFVGTTRDTKTRPVGRWRTLEVSGRRIHFLAIGVSSGVPRSPTTIPWSLVGLARLWRALRERHQILQVHRPYRRLVLARHRGPIVQFVHLDLRDWPGPVGWPRLRSLYREFSDETLETVDRVYIVNEIGAQLLRDRRPQIAERVRFLPVWYDEDVFKPTTDETRTALRCDLMRRLGMTTEADSGKEARFVLMAARLTEIKTPLLAVEVVAELARRGRTDIHLVVAGAGELSEQMRTSAQAHGIAHQVHLLGDRPREEIAQLMQSADALLLTARSEGGGPRVVLEALACGMPVVSTSLVETERTVSSGVNGWIARTSAPQDLADGVEWALSAARSEIAPAAIAAVAPYTAERMLAGLFDDYRTLATHALTP